MKRVRPLYFSPNAEENGLPNNPKVLYKWVRKGK
jgi:hypothetical protein